MNTHQYKETSPVPHFEHKNFSLKISVGCLISGFRTSPTYNGSKEIQSHLVMGWEGTEGGIEGGRGKKTDFSSGDSETRNSSRVNLPTIMLTHISKWLKRMGNTRG